MSIRCHDTPLHPFWPQDFEELVRDLLQVEWNVAIEAFKTGRDGGIDLRYASAHDGTTIVQCKHGMISCGNPARAARKVRTTDSHHVLPAARKAEEKSNLDEEVGSPLA